MKRDTAREIAVQIVFGAPACGESPEEFIEGFFSEEHYSTLAEENGIFSELPDEKSMNYILETAHGVFDRLEEIDGIIGEALKGWRVSRLSGTSRAVLRVAVYEICFAEGIPVGAAINSAVEIDKKYDEAEVVSFVNGVLGSVARNRGK